MSDSPRVTFDQLLAEFRSKHGAVILSRSTPYTSAQTLAIASGSFCLGFRAALLMLVTLPEDQTDDAGAVIVDTLRECNEVLEALEGDKATGEMAGESVENREASRASNSAREVYIVRRGNDKTH